MTLLEPHLDIDQLSAAVDGTGDPAVAAHMLICLACRQQVDTWRRTLAPLRTLPAPPSDVDPVAAALAASLPVSLETESSESGLSESGLSGAALSDLSPSGLAPSGLASPGLAPSGAVVAFRRHRNARLRRLQPPAGVAAALIAVVLLAAAVIGIRATGSGPSAGGSKSSSGAALSQGGTAGTPSAAAPRSSSPEPTSGSAAVAVPAASSGQAFRASPSFAGTAQLAAELRLVVSSRPAVSVRSDTPCLRLARLDAAKVPAVTATAPTFTETVTFVGVPGRVFVFALTHGHVAVVVRSSTCSVLATVSF